MYRWLLSLGAQLDPLPRWSANLNAIQGAEPEHRSQRWWSEQSDKLLLNAMSSTLPDRDQARLLEQQNGLTASWMRATPHPQLHTTISTEDYVLSLKWWLGMPIIHQTKGATRCPGCDAMVDAWGDHLVCCPRNNYASRHNAIQEVLFEALSTAGQGVAKEVMIPNQSDQHLRPADLLLSAWDNGQPTAFDLTVVHGWQQSTKQGKERWRNFLRLKERHKHDKYDIPCQQAGWSFATAALGTWGGWGPEAAQQIKRICKRVCAWHDGSERPQKEGELLERLGLTLMRQVARLLKAKNYIV